MLCKKKEGTMDGWSLPRHERSNSILSSSSSSSSDNNVQEIPAQIIITKLTESDKDPVTTLSTNENEDLDECQINTQPKKSVSEPLEFIKKKQRQNVKKALEKQHLLDRPNPGYSISEDRKLIDPPKETYEVKLFTCHPEDSAKATCAIRLPIFKSILATTRKSIEKMVANEINYQSVERPETNRYQCDNTSPEEYTLVFNGGLEFEAEFGPNSYPCWTEDLSGTINTRRQWGIISRDNFDRRDSTGRITQWIMEHQIMDLSEDDIYIWAREILGKELGDIINYDEDWPEDQWCTAEKQEKMISDLIKEARQWYLTLKFPRKMKRLNLNSFAARMARRWDCNRAFWPTKHLGEEPKSEKDIFEFKMWMHKYRKHIKPEKPAVEEYADWWINQRDKRDNKVKAFGDNLYDQAYTLYEILNRTNLSQDTILQLCRYEKRESDEWPLSCEKPYSYVEWHTLCEWIQAMRYREKWFSSAKNEQCQPWQDYARENGIKFIDSHRYNLSD